MTEACLRTPAGAPIPLLGVEIESNVFGAFSRTVVRQRYKNAETKPIEAIYTFPLSSEATLVGFSMMCQGRRIEGEVQKREDAFQTYDDALTAGHGAALLEQERPNVFTANVGNLLPGEETTIEVACIERLRADEGALRLMIPTLVAPRYIPGAPSGDRTGHGLVDPTDAVPDADRITPPRADVAYRVRLRVVFSLGRALAIESPSHAIAIVTEGAKQVVTFASDEAPLDRDVVVVARGIDDAAVTGLATHKVAGTPGAFALTIAPDLFEAKASGAPQAVVFLIDRSGSMGGESMVQAKAALRLCLRQLREGDRFNILAFDDQLETFAKEPVVYTQSTLTAADRWLELVDARGGTELLEPLVKALEQVAAGVVVLLTDGQVGNEEQILEASLRVRKTARVYTFGIGTNVSDTLLRDLARTTSGHAEFIHPGERIDDKVVAQFARATATRVEEISVRFEGVEANELAPSTAPALVDGELWTIFGRYDTPGEGKALVRGKLQGENFLLEVPLSFPAEASEPAVLQAWARERIRELELAKLEGRRAKAMEERLVALALEHQIVTKQTSFIVVERRTGDRLAKDQAATRVVPVGLPSGWAMFDKAASNVTRAGTFPTGAPMPTAARMQMMSVGAVPPPPMMPAPAPMAPPPGQFQPAAFAAPMEPAPATEQKEDRGVRPALVARLQMQQASGLWVDKDRPGRDAVTTAQTLFLLLEDGVTAQHGLYGAQLRKAVDALLAAVKAGLSGADAEVALLVAWLVSPGKRARKQLEGAAPAALRPLFGDEAALRARVEKLLASA